MKQLIAWQDLLGWWELKWNGEHERYEVCDVKFGYLEYLNSVLRSEALGQPLEEVEQVEFEWEVELRSHRFGSR